MMTVCHIKKMRKPDLKNIKSRFLSEREIQVTKAPIIPQERERERERETKPKRNQQRNKQTCLKYI